MKTDKKNKLRQKLNGYDMDLEKTKNIPRLTSFRFSKISILKIENSKILETFLLLQILAVVVTQGLKMT